MESVFPESDRESIDSESISSSSSDKSSDEETATIAFTDNDTTILPGRHSWFSYEAIRKREYGGANYQSPDWFRYEATGSWHVVQRFELTNKLENDHRYYDYYVKCLHFNATGTRLVAGSENNNVYLWDWALQKRVLTFASGHEKGYFSIRQAKFMPLSGDRRIVTCAGDGGVRLAELSEQGVCKTTRELARHDRAAYKLALELDSPHIFLSCGRDGVVYEIDLRDPRANKLSVGKVFRFENLYGIDSHPLCPHYFAVCGLYGFVRIYDKRRINDAAALKMFCPKCMRKESEMHSTTSVVLSRRDRYDDGDIFLLDVNSNVEYSHNFLRRYTGNCNKNKGFQGLNFYGPNSEYVVSGSDCGNIYFWDTETEEIVQFLHNSEQAVANDLQPYPTAAFLATSGDSSDIKIWASTNEQPKFDRETFKKLMRLNRRGRLGRGDCAYGANANLAAYNHGCLFGF